VVYPGHERLEVPLIEKKKAQILSKSGEGNASIMDIESFESFDVEYDDEIAGEIKDGAQVEYWIIDGAKIIKRVLG